ncbi:MAG: hypothetical protein IJR87_10790 [Bacteroidaceae bacterium]|nr:hypothetical protein [Bacteroidaceae bacterium]
MSIPYFLGGALAGAGMLTGLVFWDERRTAKKNKHDFTPENAAVMKLNEVCRHLNVYFMKINMLSLKCDIDYYKNCFFCWDPPLELISDGLVQKARNKIDSFITHTGRKMAFISLRDKKVAMEKLYAQYRPVFVRANRILAKQGIMGVRLNNFTLSRRPFKLDNDLSNDDWFDNFESLCGQLHDFVTATGEACERLISLLKGEDPDVKAMIADAGLPEDCVPTPASV